MSVILAGFSSAMLAVWASKERKKTKKAWDRMEQLRSVPVVPISGLKTLLPHQDAKKLVFLRGVVLPQTYTSLPSNSDNATMIIRSDQTGHAALVVEERTTLVCEDSSTKPKRTERKVLSTMRKQVPFVIADHATKPCTEFVIVNLEGLDDHEVPLQKVWSNQKKIFNGIKKYSELRVDEVAEEKILVMGSVLSAVGVFSSENGVPTIKPCQQLDYFLTTKSKEELIAEVQSQLQLVDDNSNLLYKLSFSLAGYAILTVTFRTVRYLIFE